MADFLFIFFCFLTILPITIFIHELGHFFCALHFHAQKITVSIGSGKVIRELKYKDNKFIIHTLPFSGKTSYEFSNEKRYPRVIISLAGPFLNGIVAFLLLLPGMGYAEHYITVWFQWLALFNLWMFIVNSLPYKFGKHRSDGLIALKGIKNYNKSRNF